MDLFTYVQFGIVWTGQDSARRSGFGSEVRILLGGQEPASTVGLEQDSSGVVRKLLHGRLLETVCRPQLIEPFRNSPEGPWVNLLVRSK